MTTSLCGNVLFAIPLAGTELGLMSEAAASVALHTVAMSTTVFHMATFPTEVALRVAARGRARAMRAAAHFLPALVFYFLRARWSSFRSCSLRLPRFLLCNSHALVSGLTSKRPASGGGLCIVQQLVT